MMRTGCRLFRFLIQDALTAKRSEEHSRIFYWFPPLGFGLTGTEEQLCQQIQKQTVTQRYVIVAIILVDPATASL